MINVQTVINELKSSGLFFTEEFSMRGISYISYLDYEINVELTREYHYTYLVLSYVEKTKGSSTFSQDEINEINERFVTGKCVMTDDGPAVKIGFPVIEVEWIKKQVEASLKTMCAMIHGLRRNLSKEEPDPQFKTIEETLDYYHKQGCLTIEEYEQKLEEKYGIDFNKLPIIRNDMDNVRTNESDEILKDNNEKDKNDNVKELEKHRKIVACFVHLKDDEHINEYPQESMNILRNSVSIIENAINGGVISPAMERLYQQTLEEGRRVMDTSTILEPIRLSGIKENKTKDNEKEE